MPPIRIVHLITALSTGGAERTLQRLVGGIDPNVVENSVVSLTDEGDIGPRIRASGVRVSSLGMRRGVPSASALLRLRSILKAERPAILQTWLYHADLAGLLASRFGTVPRLVWNIRCSDMDMRHSPWSTRLTRRILAASSHVPDVIVVNSRAGRVAHESYGYAPRRWELIPNGIDVANFARDDTGARSLREELGIALDTPVIGTFGRFDGMKDYRTFVAAAARVYERKRTLRIIMAGRGMESGNRELLQWIADVDLGGIVTLLGERTDVQRVMSALDVYCLSSAFGEGFPNALAEAMACEIPVVSTDVGDAAWITGTHGVAPGDAAAFSVRVTEILDLPLSQRRALGSAQRLRIKQEFDLQRMIDRYDSLYRELAA